MGLCKLVKHLSEEQKEAVRSIGFGALLTLGISQCPTEFSHGIVKMFNPSRRSIILTSGKEIHIEEEDVQAVLDLPRGPFEIEECIGGESGESKYNDFLRVWRRRWGINEDSGSPETSEMGKIILQNRSGDSNFKIDFVVYVVSSFLWTSQSSRAR